VRKFKAKIADNFEYEWLKRTAIMEDVDIALIIGLYSGTALTDLCNRISGKTVTLTEDNGLVCEEQDDNFIIPRSLYTEVL